MIFEMVISKNIKLIIITIYLYITHI